ncbi:MAG: hypothetical protein DBY18_02965 [Clostridia bacterium]|nr:MAG: hypothetical protein DBY18_02965 [Clostridia bacterium]
MEKLEFFHQYNKEALVVCNDRIRYAPHLHSDAEIVALFAGRATLLLDGVEYTLEAGDFAVIFPNRIHSYRADDAVTVGKFIFSPRDLPPLTEIFETQRPQTPVIRAARLRDSGIPQLAQEILSAYADAAPAVRRAYLMLLSAKLVTLCAPEKTQDGDNTAVLRVLAYCEKSFAEPLTLDSVAHALFLSKSYISHIFSDKIGMPFRQYINRLRVNAAERLLRETDRSITDIAAAAGFSGIRTFNRAFHLNTGMSPRAYAKEHR